MREVDPAGQPTLFGSPVLSSRGVLARKFGTTPFDVFDGRTEHWKQRKRDWLSLGLASHEGREAQPGWNTRAHSNGLGEWLGRVDNVGERTDFADGWRTGHDVSVFDPVLAENIVRLWSDPGGMVVDPFAGGSVRGVVSSLLGRSYFGCDLRSEQVEENIAQGKRIGTETALWVTDDAREIVPPPHDLLFSCPPYGSLEKYGEDPRCLANLPDFGSFLDALAGIILAWSTYTRLGGFVVLVVNNYREKEAGNYTALRPLGLGLIERLSSLELWEECAFLTPLGTVPVRASHNWNTGKKLGRCWQRVIVWRKP